MPGPTWPVDASVVSSPQRRRSYPPIFWIVSLSAYAVGTVSEPPRIRSVRRTDRSAPMATARSRLSSNDVGPVLVLESQRHLERVRVRRVDLARDADPLERLRHRIDLELLRPRDLFDAHDHAHRSCRGDVGRHIDRAPCRRSRSILSFGTLAAEASSRTTSKRRSLPLPSTVYIRSAISISMRG